MPELWTPEDLARFLKTTTNDLAKLRSTGAGPPFSKIGRRIRYVPGKVTAWLEANQHTSTREDTNA